MKYKKLQVVRSNLKGVSCQTSNLPDFKERNLQRPTASKGGSQAFLIQNPSLDEHQ